MSPHPKRKRSLRHFWMHAAAKLELISPSSPPRCPSMSSLKKRRKNDDGGFWCPRQITEEKEEKKTGCNRGRKHPNPCFQELTPLCRTTSERETTRKNFSSNVLSSSVSRIFSLGRRRPPLLLLITRSGQKKEKHWQSCFRRLIAAWLGGFYCLEIDSRLHALRLPKTVKRGRNMQY